MLVKIGDKIFSSKDEPLMIVISAHEKSCLQRMAPSDTKFCAHPENMDVEEVRTFMYIDPKVKKEMMK